MADLQNRAKRYLFLLPISSYGRLFLQDRPTCCSTTDTPEIDPRGRDGAPSLIPESQIPRWNTQGVSFVLAVVIICSSHALHSESDIVAGDSPGTQGENHLWLPCRAQLKDRNNGASLAPYRRELSYSGRSVCSPGIEINFLCMFLGFFRLIF